MKTKSTPRDLLEKSGYTIYANEKVLANAPMGEVGEVEIFTVGRYISDDELESEYEKRGLIPANLPSLESVKDKKDLIATHWKDADGNWCFASFGRWGDSRRVHVRRGDCDWGGSWWFAGLRKPSEISPSYLDTRILELENRVKRKVG